jgi:hypothetical protein
MVLDQGKSMKGEAQVLQSYSNCSGIAMSCQSCMYPAAYRGAVAAMRAVTPPTGWLVSVFQDAPSTFPGVNFPQGLKSVLFIDLYALCLSPLSVYHQKLLSTGETIDCYNVDWREGYPTTPFRDLR